MIGKYMTSTEYVQCLNHESEGILKCKEIRAINSSTEIKLSGDDGGESSMPSMHMDSTSSISPHKSTDAILINPFRSITNVTIFNIM